MENTLFLLSKCDIDRQIEVCDNDMIHVTWQHMTFRLNVTGLIQLVRFLDMDYEGELSRYFVLDGNMDDGYNLWIHDVAIHLTVDELRTFRYLLEDALIALKHRNMLQPGVLPGVLQFTTALNAVRPQMPSLN